MTDYEKGWEDATKLAKKIFYEFLDDRVEEGVFYLDFDHVRTYKRHVSERLKYKGGFAPRNKKV